MTVRELIKELEKQNQPDWEATIEVDGFDYTLEEVVRVEGGQVDDQPPHPGIITLVCDYVPGEPYLEQGNN